MTWSFDVPLILTLLVLIAGAICLLDIYIYAKKRSAAAKPNVIVDYARSFFWPLLVVLVIRSFIVQPYRVPTGSLEPTVLPGDFIVVNQFGYGLRLPVVNWKFFKIGEPKVGDIALFRYPRNPSVIYVKRVIGTPGDHIAYKDKVLTINGKRINQKSAGETLDYEGEFAVPVATKVEMLPTVEHEIYIRDGVNEDQDFDLVVPPDNYFMMGDNRDSSDDSRSWGFVPEKNLVGKAFAIWLSWDADKTRVRWDRIGKMLK